MQTQSIADWILYFYIYCFLGWVWETCFVSIRKKKFVNRGFMKGPLLPIYGSGAICILLVTKPVIGNYFLMALTGMVAATVLEYVTGAAMEAMFRVRYWDYSGKFLNVNGYICLTSTLCWGVMTLIMVYGIHEPIARAVDRLPERVVYLAVFLITILAAADFATSFKAAIDFRDVLIEAEKLKEEMKNLQERLDELEQQLAENLTARASRTKEAVLDRAARAKAAVASGAAKTREQIQAEHQELGKRLAVYEERNRGIYSRSIHGLLRRNPDAVSRRYPEGMKAVLASIRRQKEEGAWKEGASE